MKKIAKCMSIVLMVLALGLSLSSCGPRETTYKGTLKVKIFNNADVPFVVSQVSCDYGTYATETTIPVLGNNEFVIDCSHTIRDSGRPYVYYFKVDGYYSSLVTGTVAYPYAGSIDGETITYCSSYSDTHSIPESKINDYRFKLKEYLYLDDDVPPSKSIVFNFVKTTGGDYVLCVVK